MLSSKPIVIGSFPFHNVDWAYLIHRFKKNHQVAAYTGILLAVGSNCLTRRLHVVVSTLQPFQSNLMYVPNLHFLLCSIKLHLAFSSSCESLQQHLHLNFIKQVDTPYIE